MFLHNDNAFAKYGFMKYNRFILNFNNCSFKC